MTRSERKRLARGLDRLKKSQALVNQDGSELPRLTRKERKAVHAQFDKDNPIRGVDYEIALLAHLRAVRLAYRIQRKRKSMGAA